MASHADRIGECEFIGGQATDTPILARGLGDRDLDIVWRDAAFHLQPREEQPNELLFRVYRSPFKHADFDDRVAIAAISRVDKIIAIEGQKTIEPFLLRQLKRLDRT